jgi:hypothetical protein
VAEGGLPVASRGFEGGLDRTALPVGEAVDLVARYRMVLGLLGDVPLLLAVCREATSVSFDHLIGAGEQRGWNGETERLRRLEVDDELEFGGLLDGQVRGLGAPQDLVDVRG